MSFAEILDTHLGCTNVPPTAPPVWSGRSITPPLFAFERPLPVARPVRTEAERPVRLTSLERQTLDDARTRAMLRRAFMTLARQYHPDSHPGSAPAEHARLARIFTEASEHYHRRLRDL